MGELLTALLHFPSRTCRRNTINKSPLPPQCILHDIYVLCYSLFIIILFHSCIIWMLHVDNYYLPLLLQLPGSMLWKRRIWMHCLSLLRMHLLNGGTLVQHLGFAKWTLMLLLPKQDSRKTHTSSRSFC